MTLAFGQPAPRRNRAPILWAAAVGAAAGWLLCRLLDVLAIALAISMVRGWHQ